MKRRSFLALLGLAPVGVPALAEAKADIATMDNAMREIMAEKACTDTVKIRSPNAFLSPDLVAKEALRILEKQVVMARRIDG